MSAENKGLECTIADNNIENSFPNYVFLYQLWLNQLYKVHEKNIPCLIKN